MGYPRSEAPPQEVDYSLPTSDITTALHDVYGPYVHRMGLDITLYRQNHPTEKLPSLCLQFICGWTHHKAIAPTEFDAGEPETYTIGECEFLGVDEELVSEWWNAWAKLFRFSYYPTYEKLHDSLQTILLGTLNQIGYLIADEEREAIETEVLG